MKVLLGPDRLVDLLRILAQLKTKDSQQMQDWLLAASRDTETTELAREIAQTRLERAGELEFDAHCPVLYTPSDPHGAFVQGWQWVPLPLPRRPDPLFPS